MKRKQNAALKKLQQLLKKAQKINKALWKFINQTIKNYKTMKETIKKILAITIIAICATACGSTKVMVDKPAQGTQTTITVTTNNPITTDINPNVELKNQK